MLPSPSASSSSSGSRRHHVRYLTYTLLAVSLLSPARAWFSDEGEDAVPVRAEEPRDVQSLSDDHLTRLAKADPPDWTSTADGHLGKILIPRAPGTKNSTLVQNYISGVMTKLGWHEEQTPFEWDTPIGKTKFNNLVYTFDPEAPRKIVIAAHFDSKYFPDFPANQFLGATDSAAPCAFMLDLAEALTPSLLARQRRIQEGQAILRDGFDEEESAETTLQLLFLDGEEAIKDWTNTDSIYGARYLAQTWAETYLPPTHPLVARKRRFDPSPSVLNTINVLVLLDLLGHKSPRIHSYYRETDWMHELMKSADERLQAAGLVEVENGEQRWFPGQKMRKGMIGDDHVPFNERGVSVMHVISQPFPNVWHTLGDDASALSIPAMNRWNKILRVFTAEYLGLEVVPAFDSASDSSSSTAPRDETEAGYRESSEGGEPGADVWQEKRRRIGTDELREVKSEDQKKPDKCGEFQSFEKQEKQEKRKGSIRGG